MTTRRKQRQQKKARNSIEYKLKAGRKRGEQRKSKTELGRNEQNARSKSSEQTQKQAA